MFSPKKIGSRFNSQHPHCSENCKSSSGGQGEGRGRERERGERKGEEGGSEEEGGRRKEQKEGGKKREKNDNMAIAAHIKAHSNKKFTIQVG